MPAARIRLTLATGLPQARGPSRPAGLREYEMQNAATSRELQQGEQREERRNSIKAAELQ